MVAPSGENIDRKNCFLSTAMKIRVLYIAKKYIIQIVVAGELIVFNGDCPLSRAICSLT
jgi:hypothetical protein